MEDICWRCGDLIAQHDDHGCTTIQCICPESFTDDNPEDDIPITDQ